MKLLFILPAAFLFFYCQTSEKNGLKDKEKKLSYLALGDSYTIGTKIAGQNNFPHQLVDSLKNHGVFVKIPKIIAQNGWTTGNLQKGIQSADIKDQTYDIVTLLIGVNNQYQNLSIEEYKKEYKQLLLSAIKFASGEKEHVFVLSIPDYGYTPYAQKNQKQISREIKNFNKACRKITKKLGVQYHNITPLTRQVKKHPEYVAKDGLHPSEKLYAQWIDQIVAPVAEEYQKP